MPGQRRPVLQWPYVEGLRMDEASHPLTLLAPACTAGPADAERRAAPGAQPLEVRVQGGQVDRPHPLRRAPAEDDLEPVSAPSEYGFYANVNPQVDHPRWSQARERRIGELRRRPTLMFNGYADQVASLYSGMDLRRNY
jgi:methionine sulfoxide reductase catalytic subunit